MHFALGWGLVLLAWIAWRATAHGLINWRAIGEAVAVMAAVWVLARFCIDPLIQYSREPACDYACKVQRADANRSTFGP